MSHPNRRQIDPIEQVGTYDPMTNAHNEKLVSLNLERNMISSVTVATLAGLSSLYSLSLAGRSHLSAVLNTNTLLRHISHALDVMFRQPAGNLASAMARSLSLAQPVDSVNCAQGRIHYCRKLPFLIHCYFAAD